MRRIGVTVTYIIFGLFVLPGLASAQDDPLGDEAPEPGAVKAPSLPPSPATQFGVGARARYVFLPEGMLELFLEDVPSGVSTAGFGLELVRRRGGFDIVLGLEYENIAPDEGLYLEKGDTPGEPGENPDLVTFDNFSLLGLDVEFLWHTEIVPKVALRYGAGIGVAAVLGELRQTDTRCTTIGDIDSCIVDPTAEQQNEKSEDVPPVVPVVNVLVGARVELAPQLSLNVEAGFRNLFYAGVGTTYLF
jgi:hypothetical protein